MSMGKAKARQIDLFVATTDLKSPGHPFYDRLNKALDAHQFDTKVEALCAKLYAEDGAGRPSIPPGQYFRMVMIGYFEGITSERGIAWRCADSLSLKSFIGCQPADATPHHSALSRIRERLTKDIFTAYDVLILGILKSSGLVKGEKLALDSTTVAANASMASIVRKDTRESYAEFVGRLAEASGETIENAEDLARFDRKREERKTSNTEWESPTDPDSRVARMKDGSTKHTIAATVIADKGYCSEAFIAGCAVAEIKTCIAEPKWSHRRKWKDKEPLVRKACAANHRRVRSPYGKGLMKRRGATVELTFQHIFERGAQRQTYLRGHVNNEKRNLIAVAAYNLGVLMRKLIGKACPQAFAAFVGAIGILLAACNRVSKPGALRHG